LHLLTSPGIVPGLERIIDLLNELGNPQRDLKYVHVAGTNGKGSTSLIISDLLIKSGYQVGRFSSPHLHVYPERITVNGQSVKEDVFLSLLDELGIKIEEMAACGKPRPTEFEVLTALALLYFLRQKVELAVLEVGLGGTYDSTNVITPLLSVITGVDFDHTGLLGSSLAEIAANKAGIVKPGVPVVLGPMREEARRVIENRAEKLNAPVYDAGEVIITRSSFSIDDGQQVDIQGRNYNLPGVHFALLGDYQLNNLAVAMRSIELLADMGYRVDEEAIRRSLAQLAIPGRMEVLSRWPLVIADAAHNPQGAAALAHSLDSLCPGMEKILVIGLVDDKDQDGIINPLSAATSGVVVTRPTGPRAETWQRVADRWREITPELNIKMVENISEAVAVGMSMLSPESFMVITGSFYVLDEARKFFTEN